jgi:hypothetical protein
MCWEGLAGHSLSFSWSYSHSLYSPIELVSIVFLPSLTAPPLSLLLPLIDLVSARIDLLSIVD